MTHPSLRYGPAPVSFRSGRRSARWRCRRLRRAGRARGGLATPLPLGAVAGGANGPLLPALIAVLTSQSINQSESSKSHTSTREATSQHDHTGSKPRSRRGVCCPAKCGALFSLHKIVFQCKDLLWESLIILVGGVSRRHSLWVRSPADRCCLLCSLSCQVWGTVASQYA